MDESEGVEEKEEGVLAEVLQYSGAKWGDRDNDNVRSALASGLLWLMDALIISKQELQWFTYIKLVRTIIVHFRSESMQEEKLTKVLSLKEYNENKKDNFGSVSNIVRQDT